MKVKSVKLKQFRRFESLEINDLPPARLVVLAGPNGTGKSSLFDAFSIWQQANSTGVSWQPKYHARMGSDLQWTQALNIEFHGTPPAKIAFCLRTAYRNEPDLDVSNLQRQSDLKDEMRFRRMIEDDAAVRRNYQRLASNAFEDLFAREDGSTTVQAFRENVVGELRDSMLRLFPGLTLNTLGNPLEGGTFRFDKGTQKGFNYNNLSGGEKAAFDLILDLIVRRRTFNDTVFAIDEPEAHMSTRLQGALLEELLRLIPAGSQLWVATHSIGMMRKAREFYAANPDDVVFLDFGDKDFDEPVVLSAEQPTRAFWERVLNVALDDLADLVAPREVVICEGNPRSPVPGKNDEHDASCYAIIFGGEHPDVSFVSAGSSKEVKGDRLRFAAVFPKVVKGIAVRRVIDRDDHGPADIARFKAEGLRVLRRRHIEAYLYDEGVLKALYERENRLGDFLVAQTKRATLLAASRARGNPPDDVKSAAPEVYAFVKNHLGLVACGNDQEAFARNILAPLIRPGMQVYEELHEDVFGPKA